VVVSGELPDVGAFAAGFCEFVERMNAAAAGRESPLVVRLREHLGVDPKQLPSTSAEFAPTDHPNLQLGLDAVLPGAELVGFSAAHPGLLMGGLTGLLSGHAMMGAVEIGPVQYADVEVGDGRVVRCVSTGVFLAGRDGAPLVLVLSRSERPFGQNLLRLEGVCSEEGLISAVLADVRLAMRERNVYRGQVISLHGGEDRQITVRFHDLPQITRDGVVLPAGTIERLERHAIGVAAQAQRLGAAGRQLKRGILLHGPPGTGKTLTVSPSRTTATGQGS
jgi:hypothetical protein